VNPGSKLLTAVFLSLAMLVPSMASAVTLSAYENAQSDPAKQSKILHEAYSTALAKTVTQLRSSTFADGKEKTQQRLDKDRKLAILVNEVAVYATDDQSWALIIAVDKYAAAQPDTELEDVIASFFLTEARKKLAASSSASTLTLKDYENTLTDPAKHSELIKISLAEATAVTLAQLRDVQMGPYMAIDAFKKSPQRLADDQARANGIESISGHLTNEQMGALVKMLDDACVDEPGMHLEVVISSFLMREADKAVPSHR
jgi:hypothetical protein